MREQRWLEGTDAAKLMAFVRRRAGERKLRLALCACYRSVGEWRGSNVMVAIEYAEKYADGLCSFQEMVRAGKQAKLGLRRDKPDITCDYYFAFPPGYLAPVRIASGFLKWRVRSILEDILEPYKEPYGREFRPRKALACSKILRCVFGNPFRPVAVDPAWLTPDVTSIAQTIYDERRFADMPILADALEEAGCTSEEILSHCRNGGEHVRGCWVVDLILGKN